MWLFLIYSWLKPNFSQPAIQCAALCQAAQLLLSGAQVHRLVREPGSASRMAGCIGPRGHSNKTNQIYRAQPNPDPNQIQSKKVRSTPAGPMTPGRGRTPYWYYSVVFS